MTKKLRKRIKEAVKYLTDTDDNDVIDFYTDSILYECEKFTTEFASVKAEEIAIKFGCAVAIEIDKLNDDDMPILEQKITDFYKDGSWRKKYITHDEFWSFLEEKQAKKQQNNDK